jgi:hypothetical protein
MFKPVNFAPYWIMPRGGKSMKGYLDLVYMAVNVHI